MSQDAGEVQAVDGIRSASRGSTSLAAALSRTGAATSRATSGDQGAVTSQATSSDQGAATSRASSSGQGAAASQATSSNQGAAASGGTGELDPGKSTVEGDTDYFDGQSVITDADTVIDIASVMVEERDENMGPEKMARCLQEKGYDVKVVKVGGRPAVQFKNGDYFVDSNGDGNLGTKDQNFQHALSAVEQKFGINLSALKASKYTKVYNGHRKDSSDLLGVEGLEALGLASSLSRDLPKVFSQLDAQMASRGYQGDRTSQDLWEKGELSPVLGQLGIREPDLPNPSATSSGVGMQKALDLFGAAYHVARNREEFQGI